MIKIIAIGRKHEAWVEAGIERYQKRLRAPFVLKWVLLQHSALDGVQARQEESERLLKSLDPRDFVVLLDETGQMFDSPALARQFERIFAGGRSLVIIIGGAYGVNEAVKTRADLVWSLSPLVFPHQLVRLILTEQLYRAQEITKGGSYHHQ